ncbi:MAG TPA: four helix bundle protein [Bacteroidales bacterium]|nr:four helix bundle protein [Bacteroidales bacterium]
MTIKHFEDLETWQEAKDLTKFVFDLSRQEGFSEDFRFRGQFRSSSGSIMDNIAEGFERDGNKEFIQFLSIAKGSCGETRSQSYRAFDCNYISQEQLNESLDRTTTLSNRIGNFMKYLRHSGLKGSKYI